MELNLDHSRKVQKFIFQSESKNSNEWDNEWNSESSDLEDIQVILTGIWGLQSNKNTDSTEGKSKVVGKKELKVNFTVDKNTW